MPRSWRPEAEVDESGEESIRRTVNPHGEPIASMCAT